MNKERKVILLDIDGTLVIENDVITPKTKKVLLDAQANGCQLVLASGRPLRSLLKLANELKMDENNGLLISYNGGRASNAQTKEVLFNQTLSVNAGKKVLEHAKKFNVRPMIDKEDYMYVNNVYDCMVDYNGKFNVLEKESRAGNYKLCEIDDLADFLDYEINKILLAGDPTYLKEHYKEIMEPFKNDMNCMFTSPWFFEFTDKGIDKAKALDMVVNSLGFKRENMIAFGDAQNDIALLKYAGIGVAMGNAVQELKDVADMVTLSNEEDGIAYALEKLL